LHARGRSDLTAWVHLVEFPLYCGAFYFAAMRYGVRGAALAWFGRVVLDFLCMVVLMRIQRRGDTSGTPPELVAAIVSLSILVLPFLPKADAVPMGGIICCLTLIWTWRMLLDAPTRLRVVRLMLRRQEPGPTY
jgi:hypothetical protein